MEYPTVSLPSQFVRALNNLLSRFFAKGSKESEKLLEHLFGSEITFGDLAKFSRADLDIACTQAKVNLVVVRRDEVVDVIHQITPFTLICDQCENFPFVERQEDFREGHSCPLCGKSNLRLVPILLKRLAWTTGNLVDPDSVDDSSTVSGDLDNRLPLTDEGLRALVGSVDRYLDRKLEQTGLPLYGFVACMRLVHHRVGSDEDLKDLLHQPEKFGLEDDRLDSFINEAKLFLTEREVTNLPKQIPVINRRRRGKVIGDRWQITGLLGEGRLGKTYLAEDLDDPRHIVCVKHCFLVTPQNIEALKNEARILKDLPRFEALPEFHDLVTLPDGSVAFVMSHFEGFTLRQVLDKYGKLEVFHAAWILQRVLETLAVLHYHGLTHGDVRPEHIVLTNVSRRQLALVGFSLAASRETGYLSFGHADKYSSPEQRAGKPIGPSSDNFAAGRVAIEMLVGSQGLDSRVMPDGIHPVTLRRLLRKMTSFDLSERPEIPLFLLQAFREKEFGSVEERSKAYPFPEM